MAEQPKGWRALSNDARHWIFWGGVLVVGITTLSAGAYWNWWAYMWHVPPPVRAVGVFAVIVLVFVAWAMAALVLHRYLGWPRNHPFQMPRTAPTQAKDQVIDERPRDRTGNGRGVSEVAPRSLTTEYAGGSEASCLLTLSGPPEEHEITVKARLAEPSKLFKIERWYDVQSVALKGGSERTVVLMHVSGASSTSPHVYLNGTGGESWSYVEAHALPRPMEPVVLDVRFASEHASLNRTERIRVVHAPTHDFYSHDKAGRFKVERVSVDANEQGRAQVDARSNASAGRVGLSWAQGNTSRLLIVNDTKATITNVRVIVRGLPFFHHGEWNDAAHDLDGKFFGQGKRLGAPIDEIKPADRRQIPFMQSTGGIALEHSGPTGFKSHKLSHAGRRLVRLSLCWNAIERRDFEGAFILRLNGQVSEPDGPLKEVPTP